MASRDEQFHKAFEQLTLDIISTMYMESAIRGKGEPQITTCRKRSKKRESSGATRSDIFVMEPRDPVEIAHKVIAACNRKRKESEGGNEECITDEALSKMAHFTDRFRLKPYERFMHYVPRIVNVVTLAEAIPVPGGGVSLPLDLHLIAARCRNSYYSPKKFSAVQLAYTEPRCRVLVFRKYNALRTPHISCTVSTRPESLFSDPPSELAAPSFTRAFGLHVRHTLINLKHAQYLPKLFFLQIQDGLSVQVRRALLHRGWRFCAPSGNSTTTPEYTSTFATFRLSIR